MKLANPYKTICYVLGFIIAMLIVLLIFYYQQTYTVTFDTKGGTIYKSIEVRPNSQVIPPSDPVMEGYIFDGWYSETGDIKYDFTKTINKDTVIIAKWKSLI